MASFFGGGFPIGFKKTANYHVYLDERAMAAYREKRELMSIPNLFLKRPNICLSVDIPKAHCYTFKNNL